MRNQRGICTQLNCKINVVCLNATTNALKSYHSKILKKHIEMGSLSNAISALDQFDHDKLIETKRKQIVCKFR